MINNKQDIAPEKLHDFFKLLNYSTMSIAEKKWWIGLLPEMSINQFDEFVVILKDEVSKMTDLSLKVARMRK